MERLKKGERNATRVCRGTVAKKNERETSVVCLRSPMTRPLGFISGKKERVRREGGGHIGPPRRYTAPECGCSPGFWVTAGVEGGRRGGGKKRKSKPGSKTGINICFARRSLPIGRLGCSKRGGDRLSSRSRRAGGLPQITLPRLPRIFHTVHQEGAAEGEGWAGGRAELRT